MFFDADDARLITPEERAHEARIVSSVFWSYPPEVIAEWCLVDVEVAARWKRFEAEPSPAAVRLFELHRDRKILGDEWAGWIVKGGVIVDPENQETSHGQLRAYSQVYALCRELMRGNDAAADRFAAIMLEVG